MIGFRAVKWEQLVKLGCGLADVVEDTWYGTPALKVRGKGFVRLKEDGKSVVFMVDSIEQQELLIAAQPELYFITDHYRGYAAVLAHLSKLRAPEARRRLAEAWFKKADGIQRAGRADVSPKRGRVRARTARKK